MIAWMYKDDTFMQRWLSKVSNSLNMNMVSISCYKILTETKELLPISGTSAYIKQLKEEANPFNTQMEINDPNAMFDSPAPP